MSYGPHVYREQGGNVLVIRAFDGGSVKGQTSAAATPAQAAAIADATTSYAFTTNAAFTTAQSVPLASAINALGTKLNSALVAIKNVGILATG